MNTDIVNGIKKSDDEKELEDSRPLEGDKKTIDQTSTIISTNKSWK